MAAQFATRQQRTGPPHCVEPGKPSSRLPAAQSMRSLFRKSASVPGRLHILKESSQVTRAVLLVGGIHDNYHYFDNWITALTGPDRVVLGWDHDYRSMMLSDSARSLAHDLGRLRQAGITDVLILAHSIGGLVAKGAIDEMARNGQAPAFSALNLHAFGTPWGGFAILRFTLGVPGSIAISKAFGYPMAKELRPGSDYLASLAQPLPPNGSLHLYVGNADRVALPARSATRRHYAQIEAHATTITTIDRFQHDDYNKAPALVQLVANANIAGLRCPGKLPAIAQH